jgi:hypothetical protein
MLALQQHFCDNRVHVNLGWKLREKFRDAVRLCPRALEPRRSGA